MEKPREVPLGGPETDEDLINMADQDQEQEADDTKKDEAAKLTEAMRDYGFEPVEVRRQKTREARKEWLALRKTLFKEEEK